MSKLFKLKEWLTISNAAKHITSALNETVLEADVLQLALDGHLKISVYLVNGAIAKECIVVNPSEIEWDVMPIPNRFGKPGLQKIKIPKGGRVFTHIDGSVMQVQKRVQLESGVFDLPLSGGERIDVEHRLQQLTDGIEVSAVTLDGEFVEQNGCIYELQHGTYDGANDDYKEHPAGALPEDSVLVVRTTALIEFLQAIEEAPKKVERPLGTTERNQLLKLVIGMAVKGYRHDPAAKKSTTTKEIADDLADLGIGIDPDTVRKYLKEAANTVLPAEHARHSNKPNSV